MNSSSLIPIFIDQVFILKFAIAVVLGAFIGAEREMIQQRLNIHEFGGIRSFMLISILGFLAAYLSPTLTIWFILVVFIILSLFIITGYIHKSFTEQKVGITSELGAMLTFVIGVLCYYDYSIAIIMGIVTALILSIKVPLHTFITRIKDEEFFATIEFALLTFVVLPLLPNKTIDPWNIFNPYEIWMLIVFILGISFTGYILTRVIGRGKGTILTGVIGGIVSSTVVTQSMSEKSKSQIKLLETFVAATVAATGVMFIRIFFVVFTLNNKLFSFLLLPLGIMFAVTIVEVLIHILSFRKMEKLKPDEGEDIIKESPFKLMPAIQFGLFFVAILFISEFAKTYFGAQGIYLTAILTGFVDVDPFLLSVIKITINDPTFIVPATKAIMMAIISNMAVKTAIPFLFGERKYAIRVFQNLGITALAGLIIILFL